MPLLRPLKFVDITSSGRLLFWFSGKSMPTVLPGPLALFHGAKVRSRQRAQRIATA